MGKGLAGAHTGPTSGVTSGVYKQTCEGSLNGGGGQALITL